MNASHRLVLGVLVTGCLCPALTTGETFLVNQVTAGDQRAAGVAPTSGHGFLVVWSSWGQDGSGDGVYARWFDCNAVPLTDEIGVNTTTMHDQTAAGVATDAEGSAVIVWTSHAQDGDDLGVFARLYDADGAPTSGEIPVNITTAGQQDNASVATTPAGDFVVVWHGLEAGGDRAIFARRFAANGAPLGGEIEVQDLTGSDSQINTSVTTIGGLAFVAAFDVTSGSETRVYARQFDADGVAVGPSILVSSDPLPHDQDRLGQVGADDTGAFVVSWRRQDTLETDAHYACRYDAWGLLVWCVETSYWSDWTGQGMSIAPGGEMTMIRSNIFGGALLARRFTVSGNPSTDEVVLTTHMSPHGFLHPRVTHLGIEPGRWAAVWTDDQPTTGIDVHGVLSPAWIFGDTFESGDTSSWSSGAGE